MLSIRNANFWKNLHFATKLPRDLESRSICGSLYFERRPFFKKEVLSCSCFLIRPLYTTGILKLKTLFSESEQSKIINFVNKLDPKELLWPGKLRPLNKIAETLPTTGPMTDLNDLLERHALPTSSAVSLCKTILKSSGDPSELLSFHTDKIEKKKLRESKPKCSRKWNYLMKTVKPEIANPKSISSFTSIVIADNFLGYAMVEKQNDWNSQLLTDWNVYDIPGPGSSSSLTDITLNIAKVIPGGEHYVVANLHHFPNSLNQLKVHGAVVALICGKNDFREDLHQRIFETKFRSAARHFNLIVGNEVVSSTNMISDVMSSQKMAESDDHVYRRSLREMTFEQHAVGKYNVSDDDMKESLSQTLLVAKAFTEILRV
ncbi:uncharacterized protein LOC117644700 [Thrips palmi]|uniref:Uncharacterized protein LOC117644700 n=1 Tax=Thrips palmi TaxID=161013 RepID=A0A6P8YK09_THRPL|nr:uncharacterized protein LOC117644700 [Thrips palmi]